MITVVITDTTQGLKETLDDVFAPFGGVRQALPPRGGTVYVKPNAIHFTPHTHTDPAVLEALLGYLRDHGYTRLAVMESCTGGNFTRLVFKNLSPVSIARTTGTLIFPSRFMFVASINPCQCGYFGDSARECTCVQYLLAHSDGRNSSTGPNCSQIITADSGTDALSGQHISCEVTHHGDWKRS